MNTDLKSFKMKFDGIIVLMMSSLVLALFIEKAKAGITTDYEHNGRFCKKCSPGTHLHSHCSPVSATVCGDCADGTFMDHYNHARRCRPCSECLNPYEYKKEPCNKTRDTVCACMQGYWRGHKSNFCSPHMQCSIGFGIVKKGTSISDTICEICQAGTYSDEFSSTSTCKHYRQCEWFGLKEFQRGDITRDNVCWDGLRIVRNASTDGIDKLSSATTNPSLIPKSITEDTATRDGINKAESSVSLDSSNTAIICTTLSVGITTLVIVSIIVFLKMRKKRRESYGECRTISIIAPPRCNQSSQTSLKRKEICNIEVNFRDNDESMENSERNPNVYTERAQCTVCLDTENFQETWENGCKYKCHSPGIIYAFDSRGGDLQVSKNSYLTIPQGAIPAGKYGVTGQPIDKYEHFGNLLNIKEGEHIVAPVIEYQVFGKKKFLQQVKLNLKHCVLDTSALRNINVYYADSPSSKTLQEVPLQYKDNNAVQQDMYFVVEPDQSVSIYTIHFSVYIVTCHKDRTLMMDAMLFANCTANPKKELRFHAYICDALHLLDDMKEILRKYERKQGFHYIECKEVNLIEVVETGTRIKCMLSFGDEWQNGKDHGNKEIFPLQQEILVKGISTPFVNYRPSSTVEWVLHPNGDPEHFSGNLEIEMCSKDKKKKQKKNCAMEFDTAATKFWVNISLTEYMKRNSDQMHDALSEENWSELFQKLASTIRKNNVKPLAHKLNLTDAEYDNIEHKYPYDLQQIKYEIFMLWRNKNPDETPQKLLQVVKDVGEKLAAKEASESVLEVITEL